MLDIGVRGAVLATVFLIDLLVFLDLARAEVSGLRARRARRAARSASLGAGHAGVALGSAPS
jgi:hypothetical protein